MKYLLLLLITFLSFKSSCQSYIPLNIDTSSYWVNSYLIHADGYDKVTGEMTSVVLKDTMMASKNYFKIQTYPSSPPYATDSLYLGFYFLDRFCYLREDTLLMKVYQIDPATLSEFVALDFNLNIGDTMPMLSYISPMSFILDSITIESVLGIPRRFQHGHLLSYPWKYATIEGIGATFNFPATGHSEWGIPEFTLKCYNKNGVKLFGDTSISCYKSYPLTALDLESNNVRVSFEESKVIINNPDGENLKINLFNISGAKVFSDKTNKSFSTFYFDQLSSGMYILELEQNKQTIRQKMILR